MAILYSSNSEKSVRLSEQENKVTLIVEEKATKEQIKKEFEKRFKIKITKINVLNDFKGRKKAYITLKQGFNAMDVMSELGGA